MASAVLRPPPPIAVRVSPTRYAAAYPDPRSMPAMPTNVPLSQATKRSASSDSDGFGPSVKVSPTRRSAFSPPVIVAPPRGVAANLTDPVTIAAVKTGYYDLEPNVILIVSNRERSHCPGPNYDKAFVLDAFFFDKSSTLNDLRSVFAFGNHKWIDVQISLFGSSDSATPGSPLVRGDATLAELGFATVQRIDVELPYDSRPMASVEFAIQDFDGATRTGHAPLHFTLEKIMSWALGETALMSCRTRLFDSHGSTWNIDTAAKTPLASLATLNSNERLCTPTLRSAYYGGRSYAPEAFDNLFYFTTTRAPSQKDYFFAVAADPSASWAEITASVASAVEQGRTNSALNRCMVRRSYSNFALETLKPIELTVITINGQTVYAGDADKPKCFTAERPDRPAIKPRSLNAIGLAHFRATSPTTTSPPRASGIK